jgi:outer membrane receptor protein involved in Fe transport
MESKRNPGSRPLPALRLGAALTATFLAIFCSCASADDSATEQVVVTAAARANARSVYPDQVSLSSTWTVADALNENIPSAYLSDTESNPFQPDLYYRGFDASPVLGTAEGLAVYQNGDRVNEAFGDTVLWDTIPLFAVSRIDVLPGSDPILGLNALGGAVSLDMKSGFDDPGTDAEFTGGSFGRAKLSAETTQQRGDSAIYAGALAMHDDGWRRSSPSNLVQAYGDFTDREGWGSTGLSISFADDKLSENAAVPIQDDPKAAFAIPDIAENRVVFVQGRGEYNAGNGFTLRADAFVRSTNIQTLNGESSGFAPCTNNPAQLCNGDTPLVNLAGSPIPASSIGNATLGTQTTDTIETGATVQTEWSGKILGHDDSATIGATFDYAPTDFSSVTGLGVLLFEPQDVTTVVPDGIYLGTADWNTRLRTENADAGVFAEDTLQVTSALSLRLSGRWNLNRVDLMDRYGTSLTGDHTFSGFNPAVKLTFKATDDVNFYADAGQSSRTPTAAELSCANGSQPCLFPLSFISDPPLHQVVARTVEFGANGKASIGEISLTWLADAYDTRNSDDIIFVASGPFIGSGYFSNVGTTERRGAEASLHAGWRDWDASINYGFIQATFQSPYTESSPNNPGADPNGDIFVRRGDSIPNVPQNTLKASLGWQTTPELHLQIQMLESSGQYLRGDEANLQPQMPGYQVFNASVDYRVTHNVTLSVEGENIFDRRYATFGVFGDPTGNGAFPQFTNPRFVVPAQPFGIWAGAKISL